MPEPTIQSARLDLGRYHLSYRWSGSGTPTVVLEAGAGCTQESWAQVFDAIAEFTRVVRYDRAGLGASDLGSRRRTCQELVNDLHALLVNANLPGPYVLVGHSFGGQIVRLYAHQYPAEVVGIVLIDAVHHDQNARALALLPPTSPTDSLRLVNMREILIQGYTDDPHWDPEGLNIQVSDAQVRATGSLGDVPLVVLTASQYGDPPSDLPADFVAAYGRMAHELQYELVRLSTCSTHIMAEHSGHFIQCDEPELVVAAVRYAIELARVSEIDDKLSGLQQ
jgi:pimeloyl-ACP methyl ester carboxylesterase